LVFCFFYAVFPLILNQIEGFMDKAVIVFQKFPEPGKVKTRLAKSIGNEKAANLYRFLIDHTHRQLPPLNAAVFVFYKGPVQKSDYPAIHYSFHPQEGEDLGAKMAHAFKTVFQKGYKKALIIGTDCYELKTQHLEEAFFELDHQDLVLGPARDGGYYLMGLKTHIPQLFQGIAWSTDTVLAATQKKAAEAGLKSALLETLSDVDRYEDLGELMDMLDQF
jgi:uncharacterized protein